MFLPHVPVQARPLTYLGSDPKPVESEKEMTLSKKPVEHFGLSPTNNLPSLRDKRGEVSLTKHSDYTNYSSLKSLVT